MERERDENRGPDVHHQVMKSPVLAGFLEWIFPGFGLIYARKFAAGIVVLVLTTIGTLALMTVGLVYFPQYPFAGLMSRLYYVAAIGIEFIWLAARVAWAIAAVQTFNKESALPSRRAR